jgi:hypothetical protein
MNVYQKYADLYASSKCVEIIGQSIYLFLNGFKIIVKKNLQILWRKMWENSMAGYKMTDELHR